MDGSDIRASFEVRTIVGITDMDVVIGEKHLCKLEFREKNCCGSLGGSADMSQASDNCRQCTEKNIIDLRIIFTERKGQLATFRAIYRRR